MSRISNSCLVIFYCFFIIACCELDDPDDPDVDFDESVCSCYSYGLTVSLESLTELSPIVSYLASSDWHCRYEIFKENHDISCNEDYYSCNGESRCQKDAEKLEKELEERELPASVTCVCLFPN